MQVPSPAFIFFARNFAYFYIKKHTFVRNDRDKDIKCLQPVWDLCVRVCSLSLSLCRCVLAPMCVWCVCVWCVCVCVCVVCVCVSVCIKEMTCSILYRLVPPNNTLTASCLPIASTAVIRSPENLKRTS